MGSAVTRAALGASKELALAQVTVVRGHWAWPLLLDVVTEQPVPLPEPSPGFLNGQHLPEGKAEGSWEEAVLAALQPSPAGSRARFGLRETNRPLWGRSLQSPCRDAPCPPWGAGGGEGPWKTRNINSSVRLAASGRGLMPVGEGLSLARAVMAVTGRTRWAQAALGRAAGKEELFWALRLQGCAKPPPWGARTCLGVGVTFCPADPQAGS